MLVLLKKKKKEYILK